MSPEVRETLPAERFEELLRLRAPEFALSPDPSWTSLGRYLSELSRWRRSMNLTGNLSPEALADHALESVLGESLIDHGARVIDIGSGAGFPGLPLAIVRADLTMSLSEPRSKRAAFLRHVVRDLQLANTRVLESRAEDVGGPTFDMATVRAVGSPARWLRDSSFLGAGGALLAWTTQPEGLQKALAANFTLEKSLPVSGSRRRVIALYRSR